MIQEHSSHIPVLLKMRLFACRLLLTHSALETKPKQLKLHPVVILTLLYITEHVMGITGGWMLHFGYE